VISGEERWEHRVDIRERDFVNGDYEHPMTW
jgi:hypothetical protein